MRKRTSQIPFAALLLLAVTAGSAARPGAQDKQKVDPMDRAGAEAMLMQMRDAVKQYYYDPTFHGIDMDARYKVYLDRVKSAPTLSEATRIIAAYMAGLDDSHTVFLPSRYNFRFSYDYRLQIFGDQCFLTDTRPGSDAANKLHPGDQVLTLDGYAVTRKDLPELEYYLRALAPHRALDFQLREPSGKGRHEVVNTTIVDLPPVWPRSLSDYRMQSDRVQRAFRNRHTEIGDAMIWKLPSFVFGEGDIDHLVGIARKHKALVLDLRGNWGGSAEILAYLVGSLFDHDVKLATRVSRKGEKPVFAKSKGRGAFDGKLIVLVDSRSASAAEVLARVVQLEHRGAVVGDRTSGSVMEATFYPFEWGFPQPFHFGAVISTANLIMGDGNSLEKVGVIPDVLLLPSATDLVQGRDPVLSRAAEMAGVELDPAAAGKLFPYEWDEP